MMKRLHDIIGYGHIDNKKMHPHCNPGMEIILTEQGDLTWAVDGAPEHVPPGHIFFTLPWQAHGSYDFREPKYKIYWLLFALPGCGMDAPSPIRFPEVLQFDRPETRQINETLMNTDRHAWPATPLVKQLFPELIQRLESREESDIDIAIHIWKILILEIEKIVRTGKTEETWMSPTTRKVRKLIRELQDIEHPWTLDEMAEHCGIKRTHLNNIFRELTGFAPRQYLSLLRFNKAAKLLRDTRKNVTEIAFECGYNSSQYFTEAFKKITHLTPSEYRQTALEIDRILEISWENPERRSVEAEKKRFETLWGRHDVDT